MIMVMKKDSEKIIEGLERKNEFLKYKILMVLKQYM